MRGHKVNLLFLGTASCAATAMVGAPVYAQSSDTTSAIKQTYAANEIIVTAQKRKERAQDIPISLVAFNDEALEQANVMAIGDLPRIAPSLQFSKSAYAASAKVQVRGVGSPGNTSVEPSVAVFLDGIYVPRPGSVLGTFLDIESVEVLRGPQGTLFGRNASVGAVNLNSAAPKSFFEGKVKAEVGSGDRYRLEGMVNAPIGDRVAIRIAGLGELYGGLYHNDFDGNQLGGLDTYSGRVSVRAELSESITNTFRFDYTSQRGDGYVPFELERSSVTPERLEIFRQRAGGQIGDGGLFNRTVNVVADSYVHDSHWGIVNELDADVGGGFSVRWLAGHRLWKNDQYINSTTWVPSPDVGFRQTFRSKSSSTELQILSPEDELLDERLSFVVGGYYYHEKYDIGEQISLFDAFCNGVLAANVPAGVVSACVNNPQDPASNYDFSQSTYSGAIYGQATFKLLENLEVVGGIRWTSDKKDASFVQDVFNPVAGSFRSPEDVELEFKNDRFSYRAGVNFRPTNDHLLFATYSTGFKSGGMDNGGNAVARGQARIFDAETVKNFEVGAKTSWLNDLIRFNLTFYHMKISNYQDRSFDGLSFAIDNAGLLRNRGFEIDGTINPSPRLSFRYGAAYLDSEFLSYPDAAALPGFGGTQDLKGETNLFSPKWTLTGGVQYTGDLGSDMSWSIGSNASYVSEANIGSVTDASPQTIQGGYLVMGLRAELMGPNDRWSLAVFGENVTDSKYCSVKTYQFLDALYGLRDPVTGFTGVNCNGPSQRTIGASATLRM